MAAISWPQRHPLSNQHHFSHIKSSTTSSNTITSTTSVTTAVTALGIRTTVQDPVETTTTTTSKSHSLAGPQPLSSIANKYQNRVQLLELFGKLAA